MSDETKFSDLLGRTLVSVENEGDVVRFTCDDGTVFEQYHDQDCCESVRVEDVTGALDDLVGSPITMADESTSRERPADMKLREREYADDSETWTFYRLATVKGYVTIRWFGQSNGYYSESVDFHRIALPPSSETPA